MFKLGDFNKLEIVKERDFGLFLDSEVGEILLPTKYVPDNVEVGDSIDVFVYKDSEDRYIATTLTPKAKVGDIAFLEAKDINKYGAFLDWGLEKELLVPYNQQKEKMKKNRKYIVSVYKDDVSDRIIASQKINKFIEDEDIDLVEGQEVDLMIYEFTDMGIKVIIDGKYFGLLYNNEVYKNLKVGDITKGNIKKIREDKKIDVTIRKKINKEIDEAKAKILEELEKYNGVLYLTDKSSPEHIKNSLQMSKGMFKKALGGLYKEGLVKLTSEATYLKK
ncbi:MAG: S1-like domain-containing RNA-binding protein [Tepidibacter sp.]|jgi:predicted RNA-binding protein (virulence factor B family)|uniref:CvfB family protein n=1 Tax=Tepidibacter sp. TaxID=2529387 RepID=UPI0025FDE230|nr:S1-like domain-containing RNA-binding protein [Tepidibacter sp.]MCT4508191.1 S1-like domain-containing RNA-binding protein [Tepidibacter sp.]